MLRARFGQICGKDAAKEVSIQYGGNLMPDDAAALLSRPGRRRRPDRRRQPDRQ